MYIPPFWAGVLVTLLVEFVFVCIMVAVSVRKDDNDESNKY